MRKIILSVVLILAGCSTLIEDKRKSSTKSDIEFCNSWKPYPSYKITGSPLEDTYIMKTSRNAKNFCEQGTN